MVLICISLISSDVDHIFMYSSVICILSLEKCLYKSLAHLKVGLFVFLLLNYDFLCVFWILTTYQVYDLQIFSPVPWAVFSLDGFLCYAGEFYDSRVSSL